MPQTDEEILAELRQPIDELTNKYGSNLDEMNRYRLRQLPWQAVDILVNTEAVAHLKNNENLKRLIRDVRQIGASDKFIDEAVALAVEIYQKMKTDYPALYNRYKYKR